MGGFKKRNAREPPTVQTSTKAGTVTISGKLSTDVPPGTLNSVLKQADLK